MEKITHKLINEFTKGVDTYTHNESTWLIFTETKQWVIELTEDKTLWYNYNFFKEVFEYTSMDVVENQHYITKWVENNIINKVKETSHKRTMFQSIYVEDTIQNGVKETQFNSYENKSWVEDNVMNKVKDTSQSLPRKCSSVEDIIQNGVKETKISPTHTEYGDWLDGDERLDEIIKNGVKHTFNTEYMPKSMVVDIIDNGVKCSIPRQYVGENIIDKIIDNRTKNPTD